MAWRALAGFALACSLFAAVLLGLAVAAVTFPGVSTIFFGEPFGLINGVLVLQAGSGILAVLGMALGAASFRSPWGKAEAGGGLALLVITGIYFFWAFSLV